MVNLRRGFATQEDIVSLATSVLQVRDATTTTTVTATGTHAEATPLNTIAPFATGLNGVNQPNNLLFKDVLWWSFGILALLVLAVRLIELTWAKLRLVSAMSVPGEQQGYWKLKQWSWMPGLKKHLIYAPLWNKRHNREMRISSVVNIGTLPSRFHSLLLLLYLASNVAYMFYLDWWNVNKYALCAELRGRSGTLGLVNMVPLIILAGRNNPLISWLRVSFDTYNLLHRWIGRVIVIEILIHFVAWLVVRVADGGWNSAGAEILHDRFIGCGTAGTLALLMLLVFSFSPIRHAFYETFLVAHQLLALLIFITTWIHCASASVEGGLPQLPWIIAIMIIWMAERLGRMARLVYCNVSAVGYTEAMVEAMPGDTTRVTMKLARHVDVKPGSHAYIRFSDVNMWENHPFSIAWVEHTHEEEALPISEKETKKVQKPVATTVCFVIGAQTGFTRKLYDKARASKSAAITMRAAFEGPYAGHHSLDSYGHAVLFAGATGITHQISYLKHLIEGYCAGTVAMRRLTLVWTIRDYSSLEWIRPWMDEILRLPKRKELLRVKLFVTRPKNPREVVSASSTVQIFPGRPNITMLLAKEVQEQMGAMCVTVCGPGGLADDVRDAVRKVQDQKTVVDFIEESFTW
ncbi:putative FAD binding protein [Diplogelasinospora grovesii]|uniref:FAD binding protein n=1 Tax=Diplogelasinospora grovesii TaxID=303347 RepID=A0AAN6S662_9PEZI|nr:putative FAD binding protein [Diplogelasinospora grovesii]